MAKTSAKTKKAASKQSAAAQASTTVKVVSAEKGQKPRRSKAAKVTKPAKLAQKDSTSANKTKKSFGRILATPFLAIGRYFKGAFSELRQTRFPNRRAAWKRET